MPETDRFSIEIDASGCSPCMSGYDGLLKDSWYYRSLTFESGHIYGIISEYGQGCMYLAYLLGGREPLNGLHIRCGGQNYTQDMLREQAWMLEPRFEPYGKRRVRQAMSEAEGADFAEIADRFLLTPERYDRRFIHLSGERWRAAAAYGFALRKRVFFAPYETSMFYRQLCRTGFTTVLRNLTDAGAIVLLPGGSDRFLGSVADSCIYADPVFDELENAEIPENTEIPENAE